MYALFKNQRGAIAVLMVVLFIVLCGFAGLAIDLWNIFYNKQDLQNCVDLAALSAAQEVPFGFVENTAIEYAEKNGIPAEALTVNFPYNGDNYKVEVIASRTIKLHFLPILGIPSTKTLSARAVGGVSVDTLTMLNDMALQYAVFHSNPDTNLQIKGNGSSVYGNIHGNDDVEFFGNNHYIEGNVTADEDIRYTEGSVTITGTVTDWDQVIPIPTIDFDRYASYANYVVNGDVLYNGDLNMDGIWLINGNLHLSGNRISGTGVLLVTGSLTISGAIDYASADDLLAFHVGGDVQISASGADISGAIFAPNGQIRIAGSGNTFFGALIANQVIWSTNDITINGVYDNRVPQAYTVETTVIRLFE